ncbi:MAG: hypothetical protein LV481_17235 [Methylacidiphilales bacterium]|nr:hypothetical protein [Candidatus Methylacidiphilales bacterium]
MLQKEQLTGMNRQRIRNVDNLIKYFFVTALAGVLYLGTSQVSFGQLQDGDFEDFTTAPSSTNGGGLSSPDYATGATLTYWSNAGYNYVFTGGNPGDLVISGQFGTNDFALAGPANGNANGLALPAGYTGNVVALDPVVEVGPLTQVVTGLTDGKTYAVTFDWAGAQQYDYNTPTTENMSVALGSSTGVFIPGSGDTSGTLVGGQTTTTTNNLPNGFTGWETQTFDFTADATTETLYFLAGGGPVGDPPFVLLADVSMTPVPEPATAASWTMLFGMLILLGNRAWRRYQKRPSTVT